MISPDQVVAAYRAILGRDPESDSVIATVAQEPDLKQLGLRLMRSQEFRRRAFSKDLEAGGSQWVCAEIRHGLKLWIDLLDTGVAAGVLHDNWEPDETNFILSMLRPGDVFVDVGANIGWFTVLAAQAVGATGHVHAFEPRRDFFERLKASVEINRMLDNCTLHRVALGAGFAELPIAAVPAEHNPGHSFLVPGQMPDGAISFGTASVQPLDSIAIDTPVRLMKIDVEGAEGLVLGGAAAFLARCRPMIISEIFPRWLKSVSGIDQNDYLDLLHGHGYRVFKLEGGRIGREIHAFPRGSGLTDDTYINVVALPADDFIRLIDASMDNRVASLQAEMRTLSMMLSQAQAAKEAEPEKQPAESTQALDALAAAGSEIRGLHDTINGLHDTINGLHDTINGWRDHAATAERHASDLQAALAAAEDKGGAQSETIRELHDQLSQTRMDAAAAAAAADRRQNASGFVQTEQLRQIGSLGRAVSDARSRLHVLMRARQTDREQGSDAVAALAAALADMSSRHEDIDRQLRDAARREKFLSAQLDRLRDSTSWQITGPLRRLGYLMPAGLKNNLARAARLTWWAASLQLSHRLRLRAERDRRHARLPDATRPAAPQLAPPAAPPENCPTVPREAFAEDALFATIERPIAVIIDSLWPQPDRDAGSIEAMNMIEALLHMGLEVFFTAANDYAAVGPDTERVVAAGAHILGPEHSSSIQGFVERYGSEVSLFVLTRFDAGGQFYELVRHNCPDARVVFMTIDLHFLREERHARLINDASALAAAGRTRDREQYLVRKSDATIVVSGAERALLSASVPGALVVELPLSRGDFPIPPPFSERRGICFVGGFRHTPNVDAVLFLASSIWPLIRAELPDCDCLIVGPDLPNDVLDGLPPGVHYIGFQPDLAECLGRIRVNVAPLRYGAGMKGKMVSAMALGLPCVGTSIAVEGMGVINGQDVLVADDAAAFAAAVVRAYTDATLWMALSSNGQSHIKRENSIAGYRDKLHEMLIRLGIPCITPGRISAADPSLLVAGR